MGLWLLLTTFTGYYGLLDLGVRNSIIRFVARFDAQKDSDNLSRVISTGFTVYGVVAAILCLITLFVAFRVDSIFKLTPEWVQTAKLLMLMVGWGTAISLLLGTFGGVLEGLQQYAWVGGVQAAAALTRAGLIVFFLNYGAGILAVAAVTMSVNILSGLVYAIVTFKNRVNLRICLDGVETRTLRMLISFGMVTFWIGISDNLRFYANEILVGMFLSLPAVTMFAISSRLVRYSMDIVQAMTQVLTPLSSALDAGGDLARLRQVFIVGNRYASLVMLPLALLFLISGKTIIRVWVGAQYEGSYLILCLLMLPTALYMSQAVSPKILYGIGKHQKMAQVLMAEGIAKIILSIVFLRWFGISGVAAGTTVSLAATSLFFFPRHLCRILHVPIRDFLREAYFYPILLNVPFAVVLAMVDSLVNAQGWNGLLFTIACSGLVYALVLIAYLATKERKVLQAVPGFAGLWSDSGK